MNRTVISYNPEDTPPSPGPQHQLWRLGVPAPLFWTPLLWTQLSRRLPQVGRALGFLHVRRIVLGCAICRLFLSQKEV